MPIKIREKKRKEKNIRQGHDATDTLEFQRRTPLPPSSLSKNDKDTYNRYESLKFSVRSPSLPHALTSLQFSFAPVYFKNMSNINNNI